MSNLQILFYEKPEAHHSEKYRLFKNGVAMLKKINVAKSWYAGAIFLGE